MRLRSVDPQVLRTLAACGGSREEGWALSLGRRTEGPMRQDGRESRQGPGACPESSKQVGWGHPVLQMSG